MIEMEIPTEARKTEGGYDLMTINMGPQHPSTHGVLRLVLQLEGETVRRCEPVIGYLHTGIEKEFEQKSYKKAVTLTDRIDYLNNLGNNLAYALAVEKLMGVEATPRAQAIRVLMCELQRINSHLVWLGTHAMDIGATTVFLWAFRQREEILDLNEHISGQRMMTSYIQPGGLMADIPDDSFIPRVKKFLDDLPYHFEEYDGLIRKNPIWLRRTQGIGVVTKEQCFEWALTGPILRGSGVKYDIRKGSPYSGYENYKFEIPVEHGGDVWSRYLVRLEEMRQSREICRQVLASLPDGPINVEDRKITMPPRSEIQRSMESLIHHFKLATEGFDVPAGETYVAVESPKGELGVYLVSDGGPRPYRVHWRGPCFINLAALPLMCEGGLVADVIAAIGSIDIVLGEVDR
jgi:NADH-quinone oxidoreductase subunit D